MVKPPTTPSVAAFECESPRILTGLKSLSGIRVYGADKISKQMRREGITVARCAAMRLMRHSGLRGVRPGKVVRTTTADATAARPLDRWTELIGSSTRTVLFSLGY